MRGRVTPSPHAPRKWPAGLIPAGRHSRVSRGDTSHRRRGSTPLIRVENDEASRTGRRARAGHRDRGRGARVGARSRRSTSSSPRSRAMSPSRAERRSRAWARRRRPRSCSDLRFFVSDVKLIRRGGKARAAQAGEELGLPRHPRGRRRDADRPGERHRRVRRSGTPGTNAVVRGTVPAGTYVGVRWTVGVPFALNHTDAPAMPAPLNSAAMAWSWQGGRKFTSIEFTDPGGATGSWTAKTFFVHLGSAGCTGNPATGQTVSCKASNRAAVRLKRFDPARQQVAVDVKALLAGNDITVNKARRAGLHVRPDRPRVRGACSAPSASAGRRMAPATAVHRRRPRRPLPGDRAMSTRAAPTPARSPASSPRALVVHGMASASAPREYRWELPKGFPKPNVPKANPMSDAKVAVGRRLFYDVRLSGNGTQSCASCHRQELAFTDGQAQAVGSTGEVHPRGAQSLINVVYNSTLTWANPALVSLERQMEVPLFSATRSRWASPTPTRTAVLAAHHARTPGTGALPEGVPGPEEADQLDDDHPLDRRLPAQHRLRRLALRPLPAGQGRAHRAPSSAAWSCSWASAPSATTATAASSSTTR